VLQADITLADILPQFEVFVNTGFCIKFIQAEVRYSHCAEIKEVVSVFFLINFYHLSNIHVLSFLYFGPRFYIRPKNCCVIAHVVPSGNMFGHPFICSTIFALLKECHECSAALISTCLRRGLRNCFCRMQHWWQVKAAPCVNLAIARIHYHLARGWTGHAATNVFQIFSMAENRTHRVLNLRHDQECCYYLNCRY